MTRLELEIENHRMRAIMLETTGNLNAAADEWYLYDCLSAYKNIEDSGNCNECKYAKYCPEKPKPGQLVRYNCYMFKRKEGEGE